MRKSSAPAKCRVQLSLTHGDVDVSHAVCCTEARRMTLGGTTSLPPFHSLAFLVSFLFVIFSPLLCVFGAHFLVCSPGPTSSLLLKGQNSRACSFSRSPAQGHGGAEFGVHCSQVRSGGNVSARSNRTPRAGGFRCMALNY